MFLREGTYPSKRLLPKFPQADGHVGPGYSSTAYYVHMQIASTIHNKRQYTKDCIKVISILSLVLCFVVIS